MVVVPRPCRIERMSRVLASKSQSKLGKDRMRLEANYMYKAEDKEREWEQQQMSTALLGEAIDLKSIQQQHNTNKKNSLPLRRSAIGIHPHELSNFYRE